MCTTFSHNFKNITQKGQNHSCDTIALKRRYIAPYHQYILHPVFCAYCSISSAYRAVLSVYCTVSSVYIAPYHQYILHRICSIYCTVSSVYIAPYHQYILHHIISIYCTISSVYIAPYLQYILHRIISIYCTVSSVYTAAHFQYTAPCLQCLLQQYSASHVSHSMGFRCSIQWQNYQQIRV